MHFDRRTPAHLLREASKPTFTTHFTARISAPCFLSLRRGQVAQARRSRPPSALLRHRPLAQWAGNSDGQLPGDLSVR